MPNNKIQSLAQSPFKMKLFMLMHLPMGFIAGLKIIKLDSEGSEISVPFKFVNKNPFKSMYFAVQAMAAELSSGIIALAEVKRASVPVSMLVLDMNASFQKKARSKVRVQCSDAPKIKAAIEKSIISGEGQIVDVSTKGVDEDGDIVAEFGFTWTFKPKGK